MLHSGEDVVSEKRFTEILVNGFEIEATTTTGVPCSSCNSLPVRNVLVFPKDLTLFPPFIISEIKRTSGDSESTTPYYKNEVSLPNKLQQGEDSDDVENKFSYSYTLIVVVVREEIVAGNGNKSDLLDVIYRYIPQLSLWVKIDGVRLLPQDASFTPNSDSFIRANVTMVVYSKDDNTTTSVLTKRKSGATLGSITEEDDNTSLEDHFYSDNLISPNPAASAGSTSTVYSENDR
jgi:hypothetical protein